MADIVFHRTELAEQMVKGIMASAVGSASASGLFLAAPRRTGKSTFVREDLRPALQRYGATVLYVDLWANKQADPGAVIVGAVRAELAKHEGIVARLAKAAGMEKVTVGGVAFSLDRVGLGKEISLSGALAALSDETKQPIVLLIDEAQHAITTDGGYDALFALKAARDELNSSAHFGLRIVATGSNRDKLAMLRNSKDQAFFGAPLVAFPPLDAGYIQWFCKGVGLAGPLEPDAVTKLFERAGFRPEILGAAADSLRFDFSIKPADAGAAFAKAVDQQIEEADQQTLRVIHALTPLQSAVLRVLASQGDKYAPFETGTMESYRTMLAALAPDEKTVPEVSNVQAALGALQEKSLVWKEKRGVYSLEETTTAELMREHGLLDVPALGSP
ncbi:ATP-binding protein [Variovorax sp. J22G73]|uniref:ATP-binding protein n=1 Tax=unclassified Variovorax TaxID=663243 RepID=UPI002577EFA1|nr:MULTISPECIES: ATP-binding protein [unclassified Variovorax]MDM0010554.1 ATP-binding protein [Variovorax sp. J22R203]MDM0103117.1 ATP-binding protein [Variovorax sp. J22G73]